MGVFSSYKLIPLHIEEEIQITDHRRRRLQMWYRWSFYLEPEGWSFYPYALRMLWVCQERSESFLCLTGLTLNTKAV